MVTLARPLRRGHAGPGPFCVDNPAWTPRHGHSDPAPPARSRRTPAPPARTLRPGPARPPSPRPTSRSPRHSRCSDTGKPVSAKMRSLSSRAVPDAGTVTVLQPTQPGTTVTRTTCTKATGTLRPRGPPARAGRAPPQPPPLPVPLRRHHPRPPPGHRRRPGSHSPRVDPPGRSLKGQAGGRLRPGSRRRGGGETSEPAGNVTGMRG